MKIIDMHCDTLVKGCRNPDISVVDGNTAINIKLLKENGAMTQFFAMYLSREDMAIMSAYEILKIP